MGQLNDIELTMKKMLLFPSLAVAAAGFLTGCETLPPDVEKGPHGTIAYLVPIEASEPGARIEVNGENVGNTPVTIKIFGDRDGTFHDFGSDWYVVKALPLATNQYPQTAYFGTGRWFAREDKIPSKITFDMNKQQPAAPPNAGPYAGPYGYPSPYYYGPGVYVGPPAFYGPRFNVWLGPPWHRRW
jgi:hypothetical protein